MTEHLRIRAKKSGETWGQYYQAHHLPFGIISFFFGFAFDTLMVSDIEELHCIIQQIIYLFLVGLVLYYEIVQASSDWKPSGFAAKLWNFREGFVHFFLGTLLNIYSIFYFKSASLSSSIYFIALLAILLVVNEAPALRGKGPIVRLSLWALCLSSFFVLILPLVFGSVGIVPFGSSILASAVVLYLLFKILQTRRDLRFDQVNMLFLPAVGTLGLYVLLYFLKLVPPVPLALKSIGIYHNVVKTEKEWTLTEEKPWWRFWHHGDQSFQAKPGDRIYVYFAIHAPSKISNVVHVKWMFKDPRQGWIPADKIKELNISGGRHEGFRGMFWKENYQSGDYRVSIETPEGLEIGRIGLTVEKVAGSAKPPPPAISDVQPGS